MKVGFQGEPGAFSESALYKYFRQEEGEIITFPCETLEKVTRLVSEKKVDYGIVPVENSIGGYVDQSYRFIAQGGVWVVGEVYLRIRHSLLGVKGGNLSSIKEVLSHPQALKQCRDFLGNLNVRKKASYDTAGAAKKVKELGDPSRAAIASKHASEKYDLEILQEDIQSSADNRTRFLVISHKDQHTYKKGQEYKTTLSFELPDSPGSLFRCLRPFAEKNINLTMIQSRPTESGRWEYRFDLELEGHQKDPEVREALKRLKVLASDIYIPGSYPRGSRT